MKWVEAEELLRKIKTTDDINTSRSNKRKIIELPTKNNNDYFKVKISDTKNINIQIQQLKKIFNLVLSKDEYKYSKKILESEVEFRTVVKNTPCFVQVIGSLFRLAKIMEKEEKGFGYILKNKK